MAAHTDSMAVQGNEKPAPVTALRYTENQLLSLRPVQVEKHVGDAYTQAIFSPEKSTAIQSNHPKAQVASVTEDNTDQELPQNISPTEVQTDDASEQVQAEMPAKKKKKKRSSKKNKKHRATGFEGTPSSAAVELDNVNMRQTEYYADPPVTPAEYEEELNDLYHHSRSFIERIQQCIQRYRARRSLDSERAHYFSVYIHLYIHSFRDFY